MIYIELEIKPRVIPDNSEFFFKIPKEVILEKSISEHRISGFLYFYYNKTIENMVHYSPIYMIQWSGYKPTWDRHNNENIYIKYKSCMQWFFDNGYLIDFDSEKYKRDIFQSSLLNIEKLIPNKDFGIIYDFEITAIMEYKSDYRPLTKSILLLLLSYIRAFTWKRIGNFTGHSESSKKKKPEIFHAQIDSISEFVGVDRKKIRKAAKVLEKLGLIVIHKMPRYQDESGNWHTDETIFICPYQFTISKDKKIVKCSSEYYNYQKELEYGILFLREQKYFSKKFYQI